MHLELAMVYISR